MIWSVGRTGIGFWNRMPGASELMSEESCIKLRTRSRLVYRTVPLTDSQPLISAP